MTYDNTFLPVSLNLSNKKIVIIGGGKVALQKISSLLPFSANIELVGEVVSDKIKSLGINYIEKPYEQTDLNNAFLVYACTNNSEINQLIFKHASMNNILVNLADNPQQSSFTSPAIYRKDEMIVAVSSGARNVKKSIRLRNIIRSVFDKEP